jgi:dienelactone hydrolase
LKATLGLTFFFPSLLLPVLLSAQAPAEDPLLRWLDDAAQRQLEQRERVIGEIRIVADAELRKKMVRETILEIIGGLPEYGGPLNPRITGRLDADAYTIDKVIFESLPGFLVTANLYRPKQQGHLPAVLVQSGHTQEGKPEAQRLAANLALKGFVVLTFDPIGQGEREQTYCRQLDAPAAGWSVNEHLQAGAQCILAGRSVARYFIWDALRALDYLVSRPEVDAARVGATGCSGGGALTTFIGALDPRLKAVVPASFINSYRVLFAGPNPDSEMSFPGLIARGLDTADFVELAAPAPWLIQATEGDYFTPEGARLVYEEARRWYGLYGAEDKLRFFVGPGPHGTPRECREGLYEWMIRWLKAGEGDARELPVNLYTNHELLATRTGRVEDEPGSRKLQELILQDFRARKRQGTIPGLKAELRRLGVPSNGVPPAVKVLDESTDADGRRQRIRFESEPGVEIEATLLTPLASGRKPAVLVVSDEATASLAEKIAKSGRVVLELTVRDSPGEYDRRPFIGNWKTNARAGLIGRNLPAMRAHDIIRGVDVLASRSDVQAVSIRAVARGVRGIWALLAAAVDPRIGRIWLDRTPYSLRAALEAPMNTDLFEAVIPGFALHWDLEDLVKAMGSRPVLWTDPANWMRKVVPLGPPFRFRYVLGDTTELASEQDTRFLEEFLR